MSMFLAAIAIAAVFAAPPEGGDARTLRKEATAAYKARKYEQACALFARAVKAVPDDAALQADLGLCLGKLEKRDEAIAANLRAMVLALRKNSNGADERIRKNVAFNLWTLGERVVLPEAGKCAPVPPPPGCARPLYACVYAWGYGGNRIETTGSSVRIATAAVEARRESQGEPPEGPLPGSGILESFGTGVEVLLSFAEELVSVGAHPEDWANWKPDSRSCALIYANGCAGMAIMRCEDASARGAEFPEAWFPPAQ
jgi:tetratricopeptide (TPR) repeat protein